MGLEMVLESGTGELVRSNPSRDIAHFWPQLVAMASNGLLAHNWEPWYQPWCLANGVHEGHLLRALAAYDKAVRLAVEPAVKTPFEALGLTGFLLEPWPAQLVVVAKMGQLGTGAFWAGARSVHHADEGPLTLRLLGEFASQTRRDLAQRWGAAG